MLGRSSVCLHSPVGLGRVLPSCWCSAVLGLCRQCTFLSPFLQPPASGFHRGCPAVQTLRTVAWGHATAAALGETPQCHPDTHRLCSEQPKRTPLSRKRRHWLLHLTHHFPY